jgi:hypothetical protein
MVAPEPAVAPVIEPVFVPKVQANEPGVLEVNEILVALPPQSFAVLAVVTTGVGLTVTVIGYALPAQEPAVEVGVTL